MNNFINKNCEVCNKLFQHLKYYNRRFCSKKCSSKNKSLNSDKETLVCQTCKKHFSVLACNVRIRRKKCEVKYCSWKCYTQKPKRIFKCLQCSNDFPFERSSRRFCSTKCSAVFRKKNKKDPGIWMENGYKVLYKQDGKGIKEHIKVMQHHIGRKLEKNECVHHINEVRTDNRLENLKLMTRADHSRLHREIEKEKGKKFFVTKEKT